MVAVLSKAEELQDRRVVEQIEDAIRRMEQWTGEQLTSLRLTQPGRKAATRAYRRVICGRQWLMVTRHSATERRFLRMMLELAIATSPQLQPRAVELARYLSKSYPFEWLHNPVTTVARAIAHDLILREADSDFGNTPLAPQLGFVLFHHRELNVNRVSDYTELYNRALNLETEGFFRNQYNDWRVDLGLHRHGELRRNTQQSE